MNENKPLVSIIMPVHNGETFLSESIESVIAQTYKNWELLVVDDGSTDNSVLVIDSYIQKDKRIKLYINKTNEHGPGIARNYGMNHIEGKYTYFLDADDWIDNDLLQDTVTVAEQMNADIVTFGFVVENNGKKIKKSLSPKGCFEFEDFKDNANEIVRGTWGQCFELINSSLLKGIRHNKYKTGEDICFQMDVLCNAKKICGIDKEYYHYRMVSNSITHTDVWDNTFMESNLAVWDKEKKFLEYCGLDLDNQVMKNTAIERYTWCMYCLCQNRCSLSLIEKYRDIKNVARKMRIRAYKKNFDCSEFSGIRKLAKLLVKYNLEVVMLILGTVYYRYFVKDENSEKIWEEKSDD